MAGRAGREGEGIKRDSTAIVAQGRNDPGFSCLKDHATGASQITIFQGVVARLLRVHDGAASNEHPRIAERDLQRWRAPGSDQLLTVMTDPTFYSVFNLVRTSGQDDEAQAKTENHRAPGFDPLLICPAGPDPASEQLSLMA